MPCKKQTKIITKHNTGNPIRDSQKTHQQKKNFLYYAEKKEKTL